MPSHKPVQALQRGLTLLQAIAGQPGGASLKELAGRLGISTAATFHLVHTLVEAGFVQRLEDPVRYLLGDACAALAREQQDDRVHRSAHAMLTGLAPHFPAATLYFCEAFAGNIVAYSHLSPRRPGIVSGNYQHTLPPYASAGSFAHLAFWPQDRVDDYEARHPFELYGLPYWRSREAYERALDELREKAVFVMPEAAPLCLKITLPLLRPGGGIVGSLTLQSTAASRETYEADRAFHLSTALRAGADFTQSLAL